MEEDMVCMDDLLGSMSMSLLETQPKMFDVQYTYDDVPVSFKLGGKPPKDIFYRNTSTFLTKLPPAIPSKLCKCRYSCDGDLATIKCFSCSIYDMEGAYLYCQSCFDHRHPWYRVGHISADVEKDESIGHVMKIADRIADVGRYEKEGYALLAKLRNENYPKLAIIADDVKVDEALRTYGRRTVALEDHINSLRAKIQSEVGTAHLQITNTSAASLSSSSEPKDKDVYVKKTKTNDKLMSLFGPPELPSKARVLKSATIQAQKMMRGYLARKVRV